MLDQIAQVRGLPRYIRRDNGPGFVSARLKQWAAGKVQIKFIQPGKPTQNGIVERLNGTVRKECLNLNWLYSIEGISELLGQWYKPITLIAPTPA